MNRGLYSSIADNKQYKEAEKEWFIELDRYHKYWYDLVVYPNEVADYLDSRKAIVEYLKYVKDNVENSLEKRFIYFICSRVKVRFNVKKKPSYNYLTKKWKFHLLVGKDEKKKSIKCKFDENPSNINITDKYITTTDSSGNLVSVSIHDFIDYFNIRLNLYNKVEYVGYTKNPHSRPTNGSHTGLSDVLYKIANENFDTFIYFNIFKVTAKATNSMMNFFMPNSMSDEINVELEGKLIEKCFIIYFDAQSQSRNKNSEINELKRNLGKIRKKNKISSLTFFYELEDVNDYSIFYSTSVNANLRHVFKIQEINGKIDISSDIPCFE